MSDRLPHRCPKDSARLEPREEEPLEVECPECGYTNARNLRGEEVKICHKKVRISENSRGEGEAYRAEVELGGITQRILLGRSFVREAVSEDRPEVMTDGGRRRDGDAEAVCGYPSERTGEPCQRAARAPDGRCDHHPKTIDEGGEEAEEERLVADGGDPIRSAPNLRECGGCGTVNSTIVNPDRCYECGRKWGSGGEELSAEDDGAEILTDGGEPRVPESGERASLTVRIGDGETVKIEGEVDHASRVRERIYDGPDDDTGHMEPGVGGYIEADDGRRIMFSTATGRVNESFPEAEEAEDSIEFIGHITEAEFEGDA